MNPWSIPQTVHRQGTFLFTSHFSPLFSRAFALGDVLPPLHSPALRSGDAVSPTAKAKKTTGASVKLFKEISPSCERLPSVPCRRSGLPFAGFQPQTKLHCPSGLQLVSFETRKKATASRHNGFTEYLRILRFPSQKPIQ